MSPPPLVSQGPLDAARRCATALANLPARRPRCDRSGSEALRAPRARSLWTSGACGRRGRTAPDVRSSRVGHDADMTSITKGANVPLPANRVSAVLGWQAGPGVPDVDASALLLTGGGRVRSDADFVFYNQPG